MNMKKKRVILFLVFALAFCQSLMATTTQITSFGQLKAGQYQLVYGNIRINTYQAYNTHYIAINDLRLLGCHVSGSGNTIKVSEPFQSQTTTPSAVKVHLTSFDVNHQTIWLGHFSTQSIVAGGRVLIPLAALDQFGTLAIKNNLCYFIPGKQIPVMATQSKISNYSPHTVNVKVVDLYWGSEAIYKSATYTVKSGQTLMRTSQKPNGNARYLATVIAYVQGGSIRYSNPSYKGQINEPLMNMYTKIHGRTFLNDYGDPIALEKIIKVEEVINKKNLSSSTPYLIWTSLDEQETYIFKGSMNHWTLLRHFICSSGKPSTPTPPGLYKLTQKVPSFGQAKGYCCKNAFGFIGTSYLYHSIVYDKTGTYPLENKGVLGRKASDGCIRFSLENSAWFYQNMVSGSTVYIC